MLAQIISFHAFRSGPTGQSFHSPPSLTQRVLPSTWTVQLVCTPRAAVVAKSDSRIACRPGEYMQATIWVPSTNGTPVSWGQQQKSKQTKQYRILSAADSNGETDNQYTNLSAADGDLQHQPSSLASSLKGYVAIAKLPAPSPPPQKKTPSPASYLQGPHHNGTRPTFRLLLQSCLFGPAPAPSCQQMMKHPRARAPPHPRTQVTHSGSPSGTSCDCSKDSCLLQPINVGMHTIKHAQASSPSPAPAAHAKHPWCLTFRHCVAVQNCLSVSPSCCCTLTMHHHAQPSIPPPPQRPQVTMVHHLQALCGVAKLPVCSSL
jgi:hypothetical protein